MPRFALLGAIAGLFTPRGNPTSTIEHQPAPEIPKTNRQGGGHHGSKPHSDSTLRIRTRKRWLKKRRRNSRRGVYTVRGCRV
jgi:hypothetical protein